MSPLRAFAILFTTSSLFAVGLAPAPAAAQNAPLCVIGCVPLAVQVTPDNGAGPTVVSNSSGYTAVFEVLNTGSSADTFTITCGGTGPVTCTGTSATTIFLNSGETAFLSATYSVGAPGSGQIQLTATGSFIPGGEGRSHDSGSYNVAVSATVPTVTIVAPVLTSLNRAVVSNRQPVVRAFIKANGGVAVDTTKTVLKWRGQAVTSLARANRGIIEWEVDSTRWLGIGDSALVEVTACNTSFPAVCQTMNRWAGLQNDNKPVLGFTGVPLEALGRVFASPFGPGLSVRGGEVETGFGTPPYFSMGAARSAGLVYSTRQSYPRALVSVDLELTWPAGTPDQIKLILFDSLAKVDSLTLTTPTCATGSTRRCRAVLQADFSGPTFPTPTRKWLRVEAQVTSGGTTMIASDSVEAVVVDRRATVYGSGWWPAGFLKLVGAGSDRLLVGPSGTAVVYRGNGDSLYLSPPGDFTTLVKIGSGWELRPRGSPAKLVFDANGRLQAAVDQNGNRDSIAYSGTSDQVTAFVDPVGKTIALGYVSGKLATFTDPGSRQSRVSIDASTNQLTYDSISSPAAKPYTTIFAYQAYTTTSTIVLTKRMGVIADTTVVTYDSTFRRRPISVTLPQVQDETGSNVKPTITYTAYERQGFGALRSLDSVYVEMKDPRNNWTRSLLNRWGQARKTWDVLGTIGRTEYTAEGLVRWTEGKVADSSRVYNTNDSFGRLARTYIIRAVGDTLRLDSLVYDANHRVIQNIDARGKVTQLAYDANGNLITTITPHNDTTRIWYRTDGLVDSTRAPGDTFSTRFSYESTGKQRIRVRTMNGETVDSVVYDALGRDSLDMNKTRVIVGTGSTQWQWRRRLPFYTIANQVDSTRIERTDNCADPCSSPPAWPLASDTVRTQRVGYRFDRAGRDSLRLNDRGKAVLYLYDKVGRLLSRHPWTDSMAVRDSFVYDVAGNVKKTITRRGDTLTTNYDSRNRDTLAVIPGVGTLRRAFAGPLDQPTRLWYDTPVDSIGGVNAELRWGYDQRGRVKADTSYTGNVARATTYSYDTFERPVNTTDPIGTWTTRYETDRGIPDTLLTPLGDSVLYTFDAKGRGVGPKLRGGSGPGFDRVPTWGASGTLEALGNTVVGGSHYSAGRWKRSDSYDELHPALLTMWLQATGPGGFPDTVGTDTTADSLTYDGWERLVDVSRYFAKRGWFLHVETYSYDRAGNIYAGDGEVYNATTDRLLSAVGCSFVYDRAGNDTLRTCGTSVWRYQYDALNRLRSVRYNGTLIARYSYDVLGRRIAKRVYSNTTGGTVAFTRFVYHGGAVAFETDSAGTVTLKYTHGLGTDDVLAIEDASGGHYYVVQDKLRSVRGLVRRDGTWIRSLGYLSYGAVDKDTASAAAPTWEVRYRWTGRELDSETGLYFFRARYYDPGVRRFIQEDPIGYAGGSNVYAYGAGPLEGRDPSGMEMDPDMMTCHRCGAISHAPDFYVDGTPVAGGGWGDFVLSMGGRSVSRWAGMDVLTEAEKWWAYDAYLKAYGVARRSAINRAFELDDQAKARDLIFYSNHLSFDQFNDVVRAISIVAGAEVANSPASTILGAMLSAGRIFMNEVLAKPNEGDKGAFASNLGIIVLSSAAFQHGFALAVDVRALPNVLAHEAAHYYLFYTTGSADFYHVRVPGVLCGWIPSSAMCR